MNTKTKFSDLRRIPKSEPLPDEANGFVKDAIKQAVKDSGLIELFEKAESRRWFGKLRYKGFEFVFRYGICQSFTREIRAGEAVFLLQTINDGVEFGKDK